MAYLLWEEKDAKNGSVCTLICTLELSDSLVFIFCPSPDVSPVSVEKCHLVNLKESLSVLILYLDLIILVNLNNFP